MANDTAYPVSVQAVARRGIAAVKARLPARQVSANFRQYLDQVYAAGRSGAAALDGQNIFVYRPVPDAPGLVDVEFGVGVKGPFTPVGAVEYVSLPTGNAANATHWGDYGRLGEAHDAVVEWCRANARQRAGPMWEVYGHWPHDNSPPRTDVFHLLG
jgi:hypothetical protein